MRQYFLFRIDAAGWCLKQDMIEPKNESPWNPAEISDFYSAIEANQYFGLHPGDVIFFDQPVRDWARDQKGEREEVSAIPQDRFDFHGGTLWLEIVLNGKEIARDCWLGGVFFLRSKLAAGMIFSMLEEHMTDNPTTIREKFIWLCLIEKQFNQNHNFSWFDFLLILLANIWYAIVILNPFPQQDQIFHCQLLYSSTPQKTSMAMENHRLYRRCNFKWCFFVPLSCYMLVFWGCSTSSWSSSQ